MKSDYELSDLIKANGFDTDFSRYDENSWRSMVKDVANIAGVKQNDTVLEIGCGCGAFLFALNELADLNIVGFDSSYQLTEMAKKVLSDGTFTRTEAINFEYKKNFFEKIFSHGVFIYFESIDYAFSIIESSYEALKSHGSLCLMDINDVSFKKDYYSLRESLYKEDKEYEKKYENLQHLFIDKNDLHNFLIQLGFRKIKYFPHKIKSYKMGQYRFNLVAIK